MTLKTMLAAAVAAAFFTVGLASVARADPPVTTYMQIDVSPTSITPTGNATVTATVDTDNDPNTTYDTAISCGKGQIQYDINHAGSWTQLANNLDVVDNQFSAVFNAFPLVNPGDVVTFRAGYTSSGGGCNFAEQAIGLSPTVDLQIVGENAGACPDNQTTGVHIAIDGPSGNGMPAPGDEDSASFDVIVTACEDVYDVTAQGGDNGWTTLKTCVPHDGSPQTCEVRNANKRTSVWLWTIGDLSEGNSTTATVTVDYKIKDKQGECGKVKQLNGNWSALYATEEGGPLTKSDYTTYTATIEVTCD